jgi:hypothetical protein
MMNSIYDFFIITDLDKRKMLLVILFKTLVVLYVSIGLIKYIYTPILVKLNALSDKIFWIIILNILYIPIVVISSASGINFLLMCINKFLHLIN